MANFAASVLNTGQGVVTAKYQASEQRRKLPTVAGLALKNQTFSIPDAQALRTSPLRPVQIYFRKNIAPTIGTTKAYNHTGPFGDSGYVTVTYVQAVQPFGVPLKIGANNVYDYQSVWNDAYEMAWKNLIDYQDNAALSFLYANRCQLPSATMNAQLASAGLPYWNGTTYALEIPDASKSLFMMKVRDAMKARNFRGELDVVADIQMSSNFTNWMNQGSGNFANTSYQFMGVNVAESNAVLDSNYSLGSVFAMERGQLAGLNWNEQLNRNGLPGNDKTEMSAIGILGTMVDPFGIGAVADVSMYATRTDTSANTTGGSTQDFVLQTELTLTMGYVTSPLSTASDSVITEICQGSGVA